MRDKDRFAPFHPSEHDRMLYQMEELHETYFPSDSEIGPIRRGYPEIASLYRAHCSTRDESSCGSRGRPFSLRFRNKDYHDAALDDAREMSHSLIATFRNEVRERMAGLQISKHGYSIAVLDIRCRHNPAGAYPDVFALVELTDGKLCPSLLRGDYVQSFYKAPVAYVLSTDGETGVSRAKPIMTQTAVRELLAPLTTPLDALKRPIRSSIAFSMVCDAIAKNIDGLSFISHKVASSLSGNPDLLGTSPSHERIAHSIDSITKRGSASGNTSYLVEGVFDGERRTFEVAFKRNYRLGTVMAFAR
jgi:hypothetical protein